MATGGQLVTVVSADASPLASGLNAAASRVKKFAQDTTQNLATISTQFGNIAIPKALGGANPIVNAFVAGSVGGPASGIGSAIGTAAATAFGKLAPGVGGILGAVVGGALMEAARAAASLFRAGIEATLEADKAQRGLRQAIASGGVGLGFRDVLGFAGDRQSVTNFGDDETVKAAGVLGIFKNVRGEAFTKALTAAQDMATVFDTDLTTTARLLGKALNDPVKGLPLLAKQGVKLTDAQRQQFDAAIRLGNAQDAQAILLEALESQFGGAAEAQREPLVQLRNTIGDVVEAFGQGLIPWVRVLADGMKALLEPVANLGPPLREFSESLLGVFRQAGKDLDSLTGVGASALALKGAFGALFPVVSMLFEGLKILPEAISAVSFGIRNFNDALIIAQAKFLLMIEEFTGLVPNAIAQNAADAIVAAMARMADREREFANANPGKGKPGFGGLGATSDQLRSAGAFERNTSEAFQAITDALNAARQKSTDEAIEQHGADTVEELVGLRRDVQGLRGAILRGQGIPEVEFA